MDNLKALDLAFQEAGFTLVRHGKHKVWRCPCGHAQLVASSSKHGGRGDQNAKALLRRTARQCKFEEKK